MVNLEKSAPEVRASMGQAGRRYAEKELNFKALAMRLERVIHDCLNGDKCVKR